MEKSIVTKFCIINTVCLVLFQMIHIIIELLKKNVSNSVELTQSQIMEQMKYSKMQSVFSYLTYACILLIIIILCVSVVQKKYDNVLLINIAGMSVLLLLSVAAVLFLKLNAGNVFENIFCIKKLQKKLNFLEKYHKMSLTIGKIQYKISSIT